MLWAEGIIAFFPILVKSQRAALCLTSSGKCSGSGENDQVSEMQAVYG
jgi:hypothetical protein